MKAKVEINENLKKEFSKDFIFVSVTFIVLSVLGVLVLLLPSSDYVSLSFFKGILKVLIPICVFVAILCVFQVVNIDKQFESLRGRINEYEFGDKGFIVNDFKINEQTGEREFVSETKVEYFNITRYKESQNYLFIYVNTLSYPILKSSLSNEDLNLLKEYIVNGIKKYR